MRENRPKLPPEEAVGHALNSVHGVDLNPAAAAISRFRLLVAAMQEAHVKTLTEAARHRWQVHVAIADSLLDEPNDIASNGNSSNGTQLLARSSYHAVVGNPPYITVRDPQLDKQYRARYSAATGRYALTVPFIQRFFELARPTRTGDGNTGYVGLLCSNSFTKREFGRPLVEDFFRNSVTLTHVVDTSGAFIPGHGTPTLILAGRNQPSAEGHAFAILGRRGEPTTPADPANGKVWCSVVRNSEGVNRSDEWTESLWVDHKYLTSFPWSLASGKAAEALDQMASTPSSRRGRHSNRLFCQHRGRGNPSDSARIVHQTPHRAQPSCEPNRRRACTGLVGSWGPGGFPPPTGVGNSLPSTATPDVSSPPMAVSYKPRQPGQLCSQILLRRGPPLVCVASAAP